MAYTPQTWRDGASGQTPVNATRMGTLERGVRDAAATADTAAAKLARISGAVEVGVTASYNLAAGGTVQWGVTFQNTFSAAPRVIATLNGADGQVFCHVYDLSATGCRIRARNTGSSAANVHGVWLAIPR